MLSAPSLNFLSHRFHHPLIHRLSARLLACQFLCSSYFCVTAPTKVERIGVRGGGAGGSLGTRSSQDSHPAPLSAPLVQIKVSAEEKHKSKVKFSLRVNSASSARRSQSPRSRLPSLQHRHLRGAAAQNRRIESVCFSTFSHVAGQNGPISQLLLRNKENGALKHSTEFSGSPGGLTYTNVFAVFLGGLLFRLSGKHMCF